MNEEHKEHKNGIGEYEGFVSIIGQTIEVGQKGFTKREIVLEDDPAAQYPNPIKFTFKKDKCALLDSVKKGQRVKIVYALDGRKWDGGRGIQFFIDLTGLKIEAVGAAEAPAPVEAESVDYGEVQDDMPF